MKRVQLLATAALIALCPAPSSAETLAAGARHALAVKDDGTVWSWGDNRLGQLGDGTWDSRSAPVQVPGIVGAIAVVAGESFSLALDDQGRVFSWGDNTYGQLGSRSPRSPLPAQVPGLERITAIAAGDHFGLAKGSDGRVWSWGRNQGGQLGDGTRHDRRTPRPVRDAAGTGVLEGILQIAAAGRQALALGASGELWRWGTEAAEQATSLGDRAGVPTRVTIPEPWLRRRVLAIAMAESSSYALIQGGSILAWGDNAAGQLDDGTLARRDVPVLVRATDGSGPLSGAVALSARARTAAAISGSGEVLIWGESNQPPPGEAGVEATSSRATAAPVRWSAGTRLGPIRALAIGDGFAVAVEESSPSAAWAWGRNGFGQLGDGTTEDRLSPAPVWSLGFTWAVRAPEPSVEPGIQESPVELSIISSTPGATIRISSGVAPLDPDEIDDELPGSESLTLEDSASIKARAWADGLAPSPVVQLDYEFRVAAPSIAPSGGSFVAPARVVLATTTPEAQIYFTLDGAEPTERSSRYVAPLELVSQALLRARAFRPGWAPSLESRASFRFALGTLDPPTAEPRGGTFVGEVSVSLSAVAGAAIRYTTDGTEPSETSRRYSNSIRILEPGVLRFRAFHDDWKPSPVAEERYALRVARPRLELLEGRGEAARGVAVAATTPGATTHFTLTGADPTASDPVVPDGRVEVSASAIVKARSFRKGWEPSSVAALRVDLPATSPSNFGGCNASLSSVAAGNSYSLLLKPDGTVWSWGENTYGKLGDGTTTQRALPVQVSGLSDIIEISAAEGTTGEHSLALEADGTVWAWGRNTYGQLGDGTTTDRYAPVQVSGLSDIVAISAGSNHSLALKADGTVWAWGNNGVGQLGDGTQTQRTSPVQVSTLDDAESVVAGFSHSLAIRSDGTVWGWGTNSGRPLSVATPSQSLVPIATGIAGIGSVAASAHSFALLASSLGLYETTAGAGATAVLGLNTVGGVDASSGSVLALKLDGTLWSWGDNTFGELGIGSTTAQVTPVAISGLPLVVQFSMGSDHALAVDHGCRLWAWGKNDNGELGDGTLADRSVPASITESEFEWRVASPRFSPESLTSTSDQINVALTSLTSGATIHYTVDGTPPTTSSAVYSTPIAITGTSTVRALAAKAGMADSAIADAVYTMKVSPTGYSPEGGIYTTAKIVTLSTSTPSAEIRYTTDGTTPSASSQLYSSPLNVDSTITLRTVARRSDRIDSDLRLQYYTINIGTLAAPQISPASGTFTTSQAATMTADAGATIRYTLDGSTPSPSSPEYTGPVTIDATKTIRATAFRTGYTTSSMSTATYTIKVATPTFSPDAGAYTAGQRTTVASATPGATIYFTLNGVDPTTASPVLGTSPPIVVGNFTLKAMAVKAGCVNSDVKTAAFTITGAVSSAVPNASTVAASRTFSLGLDPAGAVWSWGYNYYGQLGDGSTTQRPAPVQVSNSAGTGLLTGIVAISAGLDYSAALDSSGAVWTWGRNNHGQLGDATTTQRTRPVQVKGPGGVGFLGDVTAITSDSWGVVALKTDGTVWAWGDNGYGQLGQNTTTDSSSPLQVKGVGGTGFLADIVAVSAYGGSTLALRSDGVVFAWGYNVGGQLGDGSTTNRLTPVVVPNLSGVQAIDEGEDGASFAIDADGAAWAWGYNRTGQLGDGTTTMRKLAVPVQGLSDVAWIRGNGDTSGDIGHALAVVEDGSVSSWGRNAHGQLADGTQVDRHVPGATTGLPEIARVEPGGRHSLAVATDGSVWAWGDNTYGQLGTGNLLGPVLVPVQVFEAGFTQRVAAPSFSPAAGAFTANVNLVLTSLTAGSTIRYTLDGSEPTSGSTQYTSAISITQSRTVKAKAFKSGLADSSTSSAVYTLQVATPTFSPAAGTSITSRSVAISCAVAGATLRYTTNGADPTPADTTITSGSSVVLNETTTLKAKAWLTNWDDSLVKSAIYTIQVATPILSPTGGSFGSATNVTASTTTPGAVLRYSTSAAPPTEASPVFPGGGFLVDRSMTLKVIGFKSGLVSSAAGFGTFTLGLGTVAAPTFDPAPGTFTTAQTVSLATATSGATIRYTLDGTDPGLRSQVYTLPLSIDGDSQVKARAFKVDLTPSSTSSGTFLVATGAVSAPTFSVPGGRYTSGTPVALASATSGADIRYTTDGSDPTSTSTLYSAPISIAASTTLKARAFKSGLDDSTVRRADYWLTGALSAGFEFSLALRTDGTVWAWGRNNSGQLGDGTTTNRLVPTQVPGLTDVIEIAAGDYYSLALKRDGTVWSWGSGLSSSPAQVSGLSNVVGIAAGFTYRTAVTADGRVWTWNTATGTPTMNTNLTGVSVAVSGTNYRAALKTDGATTGVVWSWGTNTYGQLGDGATAAQSTPVSGLGDVIDVAAHGSFTAVIRSDRSVWAWGWNGIRNLGEGTTTHRYVPTRASVPDGITAIAVGNQNSFFVARGGILWGAGENGSRQLGLGMTDDPILPVPAGNLFEVALVAANERHVLSAREDLSVWTWGENLYGRLGNGTQTDGTVPGPASSFTLGDSTWLMADPDGDGLANHRELALGTDVLNSDTNGDGIPDGAQAESGQDPTDLDMDDDGLTNAAERALGTDPFRADTDEDGEGDATDCFPLDPTRETCPPPVPGDITPPTITLDEPTNAVLISTVP